MTDNSLVTSSEPVAAQSVQDGNKAAASTSSVPSAQATTPTASSAPVTATKRKNKPRRKARRRAGSDSEDGAASDSGSVASSAGGRTKASAGARTSVFPDVNSTTPLVWADADPGKMEEVSFDEFNRGESTRGRRGAGGAARGRGRGGKAPRELTEEEKKRVEERQREKRERLKAKRREAKAKRKGRDTAPTPAAAGPSSSPSASTSTPAPAVEEASGADADASLAASTSALKLDDPAPSPDVADDTASIATDATSGHVRLPRNNRQAYTQRVAEDPKFTPRVGNFWMHDQRHYEGGHVGDSSFAGLRTLSEYWRGRGGPRGMPRGAFRGGPRGRGRGFAPFAAGPPPVQREQREPRENGGRMTEMDKLELELAANADKRRAGNDSAGGKWGHEGFEEAAATEDSFRTNRALRGRGRGRGGFTRGGGPAIRPPFPHAAANLPTPEPSPDRSAKTKPTKSAEGNATQPAAEALLDDSGAVTIRLPGESETVAVEPRPPSQASQAAQPSQSSQAGESEGAHPPTQVSQPQSPFPPPFTPSNPSPVPYTASDNGSMSSGYLPPGVPAGPVPPPGEFYGMPGGPPAFRPPPGGGPAFYPRNFPPQSFTPEPPFHGHQPRGSFSGPGFFPQHAGPSFTPPMRPRAGSPLNPYAGQMGYFVPPRPNQKVAIRPAAAGATSGEDGMPKSPTSDGADSTQGANGNVATPEGFVPRGGGYYGQPYNPYAGGGVDGQGVFYPPAFWQGGYEQQGAYGFEGEYQAY